MIDLFGTPYTKSLHIVERYRLRDYDDVKDAIGRNKKENWLFLGDVFSNHRGKFLQLHLTIEDDGVFTTPWTATVTYVPGDDYLPEEVCAENVHQYYYDHSDTTFRALRSRTSEGKDRGGRRPVVAMPELSFAITAAAGADSRRPNQPALEKKSRRGGNNGVPVR